MAPRRTQDDEDEVAPNLFYVAPEDDEPLEALPLSARFAPDAVDPRRYVRALFAAPLFGLPSDPADIPDLRSAGREKLRSAGFFGDALAPFSAAPPANLPSSQDDEHRGPPSWKLPPRTRSIPQTVLGDDTAIGAGRLPAEIAESDTDDDALAAAPPTPRFDSDPTAVRNAPPAASTAETPSEPNAASALDHPEARTGLALVAADTLLRRGAEVLAQVAGGNREAVKQALDAAVALIGSALPPEFRASAAKSGEIALADGQRRMDENDASMRTRTAIGTLANRRMEAEHEHAEALIDGDRATLAEARREFIQAWRAERVARGDSPWKSMPAPARSRRACAKPPSTTASPSSTTPASTTPPRRTRAPRPTPPSPAALSTRSGASAATTPPAPAKPPSSARSRRGSATAASTRRRKKSERVMCCASKPRPAAAFPKINGVSSRTRSGHA